MHKLRDAYITGAGAFPPGPTVPSDRMEDFLGRINGRDSLLGRRAPRWNGIETRHDARHPGGGAPHCNAGMCASAVAAALDDAGLARKELGLLATATTQGDLLVPGHATSVHAELGGGPSPHPRSSPCRRCKKRRTAGSRSSPIAIS